MSATAAPPEDGGRAAPPAARLVAGAVRAIGDPRLAGVLRAGPRVVDFLVRSSARTAAMGTDDSIVAVRPTLGLAAQAYLDEVLIAALRHPGLLPIEGDYQPAAADLDAARALFAERGFLDRPETYHHAPPPPQGTRTIRRQVPGFSVDHTTFESGWEPEPGEPGRERWLDHRANRTAHVWVARAPGTDRRSWLVCAHGFGMGQKPAIDLRAFRAAQLQRLGINVAIVVLPLHGPRASGRVRGEDLMTIDLVDSMHGMAQAAWDVRRVIAWLRASQGAERVGVMGQSLGGLVAALTASLDPDLACVIAGVPVVDLPGLFRRHSPPAVAARAEQFGVLGEAADDVHRVVSPLAMPCVVEPWRRYIYAGLGDQMSTFGQARRLWLHWDRPTMATYPGGHIGFYWSHTVQALVEGAMATSFPQAA